MMSYVVLHNVLLPESHFIHMIPPWSQPGSKKRAEPQVLPFQVCHQVVIENSSRMPQTLHTAQLAGLRHWS